MIATMQSPQPTATSFVLREVTPKAEMPAIVQCEFDGHFDPYHPFVQALWPVFEPTTEEPASAMVVAVKRQWQWHDADPTSHWYYVFDEVSGRGAGAAQWHFYETNPFAFAKGGPELDAYWWPEGDASDFATIMLQQTYGKRIDKMNRPHTC